MLFTIKFSSLFGHSSSKIYDSFHDYTFGVSNIFNVCFEKDEARKFKDRRKILFFQLR